MDMQSMLLPLVRQAGQIMLSAHEIDREDAVSEKGDAANLVTIYDVRVQEFLIQEISDLLPDAYFFAEEKENDPNDLLKEHCFIIDPIDGTANFVHEYHHSAISVAMVSKGEVVFGAVYDPYQDELFHAVKGCGAYLNGVPIRVSDRTMSTAIGVFGTSPYYKTELACTTFRLCERIFSKCADLRRSGAASLDLAYVSAGRCEFFFECRLSPWDYAAGMLLIAESGGVISDMDGNPLSLDAPHPVIAANSVVYEQLCTIAKESEKL